MELEIETGVKIDMNELARSMTREQMLELITVMCENEQDLDFEMDVARLVVKNIKDEFTNGFSVDPEFKIFIKSLKKV